MNNNKTLITNLKDKPHLFQQTLNLIESSFNYQKPNSFLEDFAPLIDSNNHHNCFILLDESENVLAHIGAKDKYLKVGNESFVITMLGGIAVDESRRGEGHFQTLFQDVLAEKRSDTSLFLLWSDMEKLYNKFGFYLCGTQFEIGQKSKKSPFIQTKYHALKSEEKKEIQNLYNTSFAGNFLTLQRHDEDWKLIEKITSADLYIRKDKDSLRDYYFINKGQDLPGVIYEYGSTGKLQDLISEISVYGKVWMGTNIVATELVQFQFFMSPGDLKLFTNFILKLTNNKISIRNINVMKQEVYFDFNDELLCLETQEFLRGIFGPGTFEELELPALFLSGLDSI